MKEIEPRIDGRSKYGFKSVFQPENLLLVLEPIAPNISPPYIKREIEEKSVSLERKLELFIDPDHRESLALAIERGDLVEATLIEASNFPLLNKGQEKALAQIVAKGKKAISNLKRFSPGKVSENELIEATFDGAAARKFLICCNWRLVTRPAKEYKKRGVPLPLVDLFQEGTIALVRAIEGFKPEKNIAFSTYATNKIKWHLMIVVTESGYLARIPRYLIGTVIRLNRIASSLELELKRKPTDKEIAAKLRIDPEIITRLRRVTTPYLSLNKEHQSGKDGKISFLYEFISDAVSPTIEEIEEEIDREILRETLGEILASFLPERERLVLEMYWGLNGNSHCQLKEIGEKWGLTTERVRQIKDRALKRLFQSPYRSELETFL